MREINSGKSKYGKLAKNTLIFLLGNLGSKIISFIIVPFYTYVLTTAEYGTVDLFTTTVNILIPFVILGLNEAVLRFLTGKEMDPESVASNCFMLFLLNTLLVWMLLPAYKYLNILQGYYREFILLLTIMAFNQIYLQYLRGVGLTMAYAAHGIIITFVTVLSNCVFLLWLKLGVAGYLLSMILAQLAGCFQIVVVSKLWRNIRFKYIDISKLKKMLIYCIPLIPNSLMWWVMGASDKYMISYFIGTSGNGIYSVAQKIPTIIQMFYSVFMQAWQISAIEEGQSKDRGQFYNNIYQYLTAFLMITGSAIIVIARPLYETIMSLDFQVAWHCVPLLIIANIFSCLSGFFGTTYVVNKQSRRAFSTTAIGAGLNITLNFIFISMLGLSGAAIGTCASYYIVTAIRSKDTYQYIGLRMNYAIEGLAVLLMLLQNALLWAGNGPLIYIAEVILWLGIVLLFHKQVHFILVNIIRFIKKKMKHHV